MQIFLTTDNTGTRYALNVASLVSISQTKTVIRVTALNDILRLTYDTQEEADTVFNKIIQMATNLS